MVKTGLALRVGELFAGVGGFRVGLQGLGTKEHPGAGGYEVVFSNQYEPKEKQQFASTVYAHRFGEQGHSNEDIFEFVKDPGKFAQALEAKLDILVGGFPCQDYSVARLLNQAKGLAGKKGVLWWSIYDFLKQSLDAGQPLKYVLLENVDALIRAPASNPGRDFASILSCLAQLGYVVEWRVVNSAEHGWPQQRKRTFILAYHKSTELAAKLSCDSAANWLSCTGVFATAFASGPLEAGKVSVFELEADPVAAQASYVPGKDGRTQFGRGGVFADGVVTTANIKVSPSVSPEAAACGLHTLGDVIVTTDHVPEEFFISDDALPRWKAAKGGKKKSRKTPDGFDWVYSEGAMAFPDRLNRSSRTIITSEGGSTPRREKHVVMDATGRLRRLIPDELDVLSGFPRGWTGLPGVPDAKRARLVGNALVTGVVMQIGKALIQHIASCT